MVRGRSCPLSCGYAPEEFRRPAEVHADRAGALHVEALAVRYDEAGWLRRFDALWPADSPAATSYRRRITDGPAYEPAQALRDAVRIAPAARPRAFSA